MPWEKQFDVDRALNQAMHAFWARGYEATSVQDLVERMGINRGSLYATFGDKRALFIQALRRYDALHRQAWLDDLARSDSARQAIEGAFEGVVATALKDGSRDGCFLVNTALELSPHDKEISGIVARGLSDMERFFRRMITEGQASGDIAPHLDPVGTARSLLALFVGLRVLSRSRAEAPLLRSIVRQVEALLD